MTLYGAGGHAKSVRDVLESAGIHITAVYDDNDTTKQFMEMAVTHSLATITQAVICIGDNRTRSQKARLLAEKGIAFPPAVCHRTATVSPYATIGEGTVVMPGATINSGARIGRHCIVNTNAIVEHDCVVGDFAHIASNATLSGGVNIGEGTLVGTGATVIQGIRIGEWSIIGAGAVAVHDIPDNVVAVGIPCKTSRKL